MAFPDVLSNSITAVALDRFEPLIRFRLPQSCPIQTCAPCHIEQTALRENGRTMRAERWNCLERDNRVSLDRSAHRFPVDNARFAVTNSEQVVKVSYRIRCVGCLCLT